MSATIAHCDGCKRKPDSASVPFVAVWHALDAAQVVALGKITPQLVVCAKEEQARKARKHGEQRVREQLRTADPIRKQREREIHEKSRDNDDEGIGNGEQELAQPEVRQYILVIPHVHIPLSGSKYNLFVFYHMSVVRK